MQFSFVAAAAAVLVVWLSCAAPTLADPLPAPQGANPPNDVTVGNIVYGGSGCPQGSAAVALSQDKRIFTVLYDTFIASSGPGINIDQTRKNCGVNFRIRVPGGFQVAIVDVSFRGFAKLDMGLTGSHRAIYYFAGSTDQAVATYQFVGPLNSNYLIDTKVGTAIWSPCGPREVNFNINSQVVLNTGGNSQLQGLLTTDSQDNKVSQIFRLEWRECRS